MGAASGAIYGVAVELTPLATLADGMVFGASVWLTADNGVLQPPRTPATTHVYALASHLAYGL